MPQPLLECRHITFTYPMGEKGIHDISLTIQPGERIALIGSNGSGKSTFFLNLAGVYPIQQGQIVLKGTPLAAKDLASLRQAVGLVFQEADNQLIASSVEAEVAFGPMNLGLKAEALDARVNQALDFMDLQGLRKRPPHYLSGGEKKRVTIADILAMESSLILFDEPTASLDPANIRLFRQVLDKLDQAGDKALMISSHDMDFVYEWADRVLVFHRGILMGQGPPQEVFAREDLINKANLQAPLLWSISHCLQEAGILGSDQTVKNMEQLRKNILGE